MYSKTIALAVNALYTAASELPEETILRFDKNLLLEIVVSFVNIMVLVLVLAFVLYKPVKKFMQTRNDKIQTRIDTTAEELEKATALRQEYEEKLANIDTERDAILQAEREAALERSEEIIADARREAANIYRRSMEDLRMEQENSMDDMRKAIIEISTRMAGEFVTVSIDRDTQDRYIDEAMSHLEETLWES